MSIRTVLTPASASLAAIASRFASLWAQVQWNWAPTAARGSSRIDPGSASVKTAEHARSAAVRARGRRIAGQGSDPAGWFDGSRPRLDWGSPADVAQLVEHFTRNEGVPGSSPGVGF